MACEMEKTNLELLDILVDMFQKEVDDLGYETVDLYGSWTQACDVVKVQDTANFNNIVNVFRLAEFLDALESENLTEECKEALDKFLDSYHDWNRMRVFKNDVRATRREAQDRYAKCLHELKGGMS
jgi:hypothetical protein